MKKVKVQKIYKGYCSIRNYIVEEAISKNETIIVEYNKEKMELNPSQLKKYIQLSTKIFRSQYDEKPYKLYDYKWNPNKEIKNEIF